LKKTKLYKKKRRGKRPGQCLAQLEMPSCGPYFLIKNKIRRTSAQYFYGKKSLVNVSSCFAKISVLKVAEKINFIFLFKILFFNLFFLSKYLKK
jgi:hypothetical protein